MGSKDSDKELNGLEDLLSKMRESHIDKIKSKPGITVTDKEGKEKDPVKYAKEKELDEFAKDAREVRSETISKYHKEIDRKSLTIPEHRHQKKKIPYWTDLNQRTKEAGHVKHLTKEDILYEQDLQRDQANYKRYGQPRDEELLNYIKTTTLENAKRKANNKKAKSLYNFAVLNSLQRGAATAEEHAQRINLVMETHGIGFMIQPIQVTNSIRRMLITSPTSGDTERFLAKYLITVPKDGKNDTMFGFITDTMKVETTKFQAGTYFRLPKGCPKYTEEMLLKDVPTLKTLEVSPLYLAKSKKTEEEENNWAKRINDVKSQKWQRLTELKTEYIKFANLTKNQFMFCFLSTRPGEVFSATELSEECIKFAHENPNERGEQWTKVVSTECNNFHSVVRDEKNPASKLTFEKQKTMRSIEVGAIPELSLINIKDQITILKAGHSGWVLLQQLCKKIPALDCAVNPDKQCNPEDKPVIEESKEKPVDQIKREEPETITEEESLLEDVVIEDGVSEEMNNPNRDTLNVIANGISHIISHGVEVNLNINFGRFQPKQSVSNDHHIQKEMIDSINKLEKILETIVTIVSKLNVS